MFKEYIMKPLMIIMIMSALVIYQVGNVLDKSYLNAQGIEAHIVGLKCLTEDGRVCKDVAREVYNGWR